MTTHVEQAMPVPNNSPSVQSMVRTDLANFGVNAETRTLVLEDMVSRERLGIERYGVALQPHNGRDALRDLYEELLDGANYARQVIAENPKPLHGMTDLYVDLLRGCCRVRKLMAAREVA